MLKALVMLISTIVLLPVQTFATDCDDFMSAVKPLNIKSGELRYRIYGAENAQTIVLFHGMGGDFNSFYEVIRPLARKYRVVHYEQRGHGGSAAIGDNYTTETMARDAKALFEHLGIEHAVLVGSSMGARVAARFAIMYPELVDGVVISDMDLIRRTSDNPEKQRRALLKAREVRRRMNAGPYDTREQLAAALSPFFNEADFEWMTEAFVQTEDGRWTVPPGLTPDNYLLYWNQANRDDLLGDLAKANRPTLILRADAAQFWTAMTDEGVRQVRARFPAAKLVTGDGADHVIDATQTGAFLSEVDRFISQSVKDRSADRR
jgi:pimeloyl-ACP methyl ester carboxylesterase